MDMKIDHHLDKKKNLQENINSLYDHFFNKNIQNHKTIIKYVHGCTRLAQKIIQVKRNQTQRKNISRGKIGKKIA